MHVVVLQIADSALGIATALTLHQAFVNICPIPHMCARPQVRYGNDKSLWVKRVGEGVVLRIWTG